MKKTIVSFTQRIFADQRGQVLPWVVLGMSMFIGSAGMAVDLGHAYVVHAQLQNDANAAALAAAGQVYVSQTESSDATNVGGSYSGSGGDKNVDSALGTVSTTVTPVCLNALEPTGETCATGSPDNAVKVKESATVPTFCCRCWASATFRLQPMQRRPWVEWRIPGTSQSLRTRRVRWPLQTPTAAASLSSNARSMEFRRC